MNKFLKAVMATVFFVACLLATYVLRMRYGQVDVVFYSTIGCAVVAVMAAGALLYGLRAFSEFSGLEKFQMLVIWLLVGYAFAISVPTVIDRSLSFYLLEKLQQRGGGIRQDRFQDVFVKEYMIEHRLVDVRLTEQLESGTIEINNGCVRLTPRGERLASFSRWFRATLLPRHRLLMGEYTDDLTNPFRNSTATVDYTCR
ncbi:MAG: hypothetical protein NT117_02990 [Gammaproteobacteria bacterium]|nr:hypothetical protein [Gammaproteobacteria bacterium]